MNTDFRHDSCVSGVPAAERSSWRDRRRTRRPGQPGRRAMDVARAGVFAALCALVAPSLAAAQSPIHFGLDAKSVGRARAAGMPVAYGSTWAGAWNQKYGWGGIEDDLRAAKAAGAVPVVQWWYWGDDISPICVENGCTDRYQGVQKDKATWTRLSTELADLIVRVMGPGSGALVIVETEFNKNGIEGYEAFDGYLVEQFAIFQAKQLRVILGFGNWGQSQWPNFDRAVGAADLLGVMALQSSVRDEPSYLSGAEQLVSAARYNQATFGKPSFVTDFAFSSYPSSSYELYQDTVVLEIFTRIEELRAAGVQGMVWRMLVDDPNFDTANYHGMAERHWGLLRADGTEKLAFGSFRDGVLAEADIAEPEAPEATPAPANLIASPGDARVTLSWTPVSGTTGYTVKSSTTGGGPYQTVQAGISTASFLHTGLTNGVTYFYVVSATNSAGAWADSSETSAKPIASPPAAPTGLTATAGNAQVTVAWGAVAGATSYTVKYATVNGGSYQDAAAGLSSTSFTHGGRTNGTTYYYVVSASNTGGQSSNSSQVSVTPVAPAPPPATGVSVWSPVSGTPVSGTSAFKARLEGKALSAYKMYWQVGGGQLNLMSDSNVDGAHKEALVNVTTWTWNGNGPYVLTFVAKDSKGKKLGEKSVTIYIAR